jgi:hypothetical protein
MWRDKGEPLYALRAEKLPSKAFVPEGSFLKLPGEGKS